MVTQPNGAVCGHASSHVCAVLLSEGRLLNIGSNKMSVDKVSTMRWTDDGRTMKHVAVAS